MFTFSGFPWKNQGQPLSKSPFYFWEQSLKRWSYPTMRLSSTDMKDINMLFAAIPSICASSPKISIYNEEMIVARCFIGFLIFSRKSLGKTFKETLDGRIESIQEELQQFFNPNEVIPEESNEQQ
jgi:hypothetical protein